MCGARGNTALSPRCLLADGCHRDMRKLRFSSSKPRHPENSMNTDGKNDDIMLQLNKDSGMRQHTEARI